MNIKYYKIVSCVSFCCIVAEDLLVNVLGLKIGFFYDRVHYFQCNNNPFIIIFSLCIFCIFLKWNCKFNISRNIAGLTLYIYLIHGNVIVRNIYIPMLFGFIKNVIGYEHLVLMDIIVSLIIFLTSLLISFIYNKTGSY